MDEIICRIIDLPHSVNAVTVVDENGCFNVYVNAHLSKIEQKKAYLHECKHIKKCHFFKDIPVKSCEQEAKE